MREGAREKRVRRSTGQGGSQRKERKGWGGGVTDAVPGRVVLFVKFLFDLGGDILLDAVLAQSCSGTVDSILLHLVAHVGVLDDSSSHFTHDELEVVRLKGICKDAGW